MSHVHWWLFALSFAMGLVLTFALIIRPVKSQVPVGKSATQSAEPEPPTTRIRTGQESPTTRIRVAKEPPTTRIRVGKEPPTTKIPIAQESPTRKIPTVPIAPYGPGSAQAEPGGGGPAGWLVKGHSETRLYYTPDDPTYDSTVPQVWFKNEEAALRAGFMPRHKGPKKG